MSIVTIPDVRGIMHCCEFPTYDTAFITVNGEQKTYLEVHTKHEGDTFILCGMQYVVVGNERIPTGEMFDIATFAFDPMGASERIQ